jgi:hypothetical protein
VSEPAGYIRGAGGAPVDRRRLTAVLAGLLAAAVAAVLLAGTVGAVREARRVSRIQQDGVVVPVTVTGCVGLGSGTGVTVSGYRCRGAFSLGGRRHEAVLRGSDRLLPTGSRQTGVTLPADPEVLYLCGAGCADAYVDGRTVGVSAPGPPRARGHFP